MRRIQLLVSFALSMARGFPPACAAAQDPTYTPIVVQWPGGARGAAMGDAAIVLRGDEALFSNPAQIGADPPRQGPRPDTLQVHDASIGWQRIGTATVRSVSAEFATGTLGVALGARHLALEAGSLPLSSARVEDEGVGSASSFILVAGLARALAGFRIGAALTYGEDRAGNRRIPRTLVDLGVSRPVDMFGWPRGALQVGATLRHFGTSASLDGVHVRVPTEIGVGMGLERYAYGSLDLSASGELALRWDGRVLPRVGGEVAWFWIEGYAAAVRAGLRRPGFDGQSLVTLGMGLRRDNVFLDYAFEPPGSRPASHRLSLHVE